ncbi:LysE family translocator [Pseudoduganella albidiflava]|uniref:LysE family translocator n=1 Tax=Pseudoduganella albidiflava TaxID=321983 RepID=A0A411WXG2_9BURK|nr:LysE family translocator [Pseudoduganella albidiflava]QBI01267.1 LysE family translocator [Pseudoduganella albidiflava]GGY37038.1 lysine transporter LysE [Pseudoduganella albidiflava]
MTLYLSMAAFALASSITPGPVNIVALGAGARHGLLASMRHVSGATIGFTVLLLLVGLGLYEMLERWPQLMVAIRWAGIAFLFWLAWQLAADNGELSFHATARGPSLLTGAAMQWLNPKAWLAAVSGMGAYAVDGDGPLVWQFAAIYFVVCWLSIFCWAWAGTALRGWLANAARVRLFNRSMAALLAASAAWLLAN